MAASSKAGGGLISRGQPGFLDQNLPQEYQHRIMKKIAQLTKVIYQLNVQNEEHNNFVQHLKSIHEEEVRRLVADHQERMKKEQDDNSREVGKLREHVSASNNQLNSLQKVNTQLREEREEMAQQHQRDLGTLRLKHDASLKDVRADVTATREDLAEEKTKLATLQNWCDVVLPENIKKVRTMYERELQELRETAQQERKRCEAEMEAQRVAHCSEVQELKDAQKRDLLVQHNESAQSHDHKLAMMTQEWQERQKALESNHSAETQQLNQRISSLTGSLREAEDRYTTAEQKLCELEQAEEENRCTLGDTESRLKGLERERDGLRRQVADLRLELDLSQEKYRQQSQELTAMSGGGECSCACYSATFSVLLL